MATIAGLPPAPSVYSPLVNRENARKRRNIVLQRMAELEYITPEEAAAARAEPLRVKASAPKRLQVEAPYFTSYIQKQLPKYVSKEALEMGGLTVETTLNREWQKIAEEVVKEAVELDGASQGFEQAALVAIAPKTGAVKAMVGGRSFEESEFNRVTQAQRQPGSTFKGFVYTAAIAAGWSPYDGYEDANFKVDGYKPRNFGGKYRGWVSMRDALTSSINVVAVKVLMDIGFEPTIKLARDMGIKSKLEPIYSLALGGSEVNLLELTSAYGTIAAEGRHYEPHGIVRVVDRRGKTIYAADFKPKGALDDETASIMTWMLEPVVQYGTGAAAQLRDRPVAGKTGTSDEARDLWFIGFIPQLVTGVWLGNDDSYPTWGSSSTAAFTWRQFMDKVTEELPVQEFPELPELDDRNGFLKAQPVQPHSVYYGDTTPDNAQSGSANANDYSDGYYY
jgi:penicillin-binding protein 1A